MVALWRVVFLRQCADRRYALSPRVGRSMRQDQSGGVIILTALAITMLVGLVGLALDVGMWYRTNRAMQNAADAAVIAAATNGTSTYQAEAKAVAATYGFVDGSGGITVTALN